MRVARYLLVVMLTFAMAPGGMGCKGDPPKKKPKAEKQQKPETPAEARGRPGVGEVPGGESATAASPGKGRVRDSGEPKIHEEGHLEGDEPPSGLGEEEGDEENGDDDQVAAPPPAP